ncbi:MAG: 2-dehydropantoate 2-reductase [Gemmatimonadota bacterium]|uniref:2-dehydropantoate 2-reductase n=1 Tax=marine metagenome TaxID=408172 RepID=A0A382DHC4_9ZZZZ|nr:2-dehydropantoate 2-reductase [Gemmatimonadota bacterium]
MRIAIIGAGGAGGYFGARWAEAGLDVTLLARGAHLQAILSKGLSLESPLGDAHVNVPAVSRASEVGEVDVVMVATKSWQLRSLADVVQPLIGSNTIVFGLQNGVEAADILTTFVPPSCVLGATCRIISLIEEPGVIRHVGIEPTLTIGELPGSASAPIKFVTEVLDNAKGLTVEIADDIVVELWRKFLFFAPMSGLGSITQAPIGVFRSVRQSRSLLIRAVEEVFNLARAKGVRLPPESVEQTLQFIDRLPADGTSSLQRDFQDGVRTELEALSGAVVRQAADAGVATPVHTFFYSSLLPLELKARGSIEWPESD